MEIYLAFLPGVFLLSALLALAYFVFARVRSDYQALGQLSRPVAILQTGFFAIYALSSYLFLDSRLSHIRTAGWLFPLAILLMLVGFLMVAFSMPFLGRRSFGLEVGGLRTSGLYRYTRNPQLVGGFLFVAGYALLWPSWLGRLWVGVWLIVAHWMVQGEEAHLKHIFGDAYADYCARTPRYLGLPRQ